MHHYASQLVDLLLVLVQNCRGLSGKTNRSFVLRFRTSFSLKSYCPALPAEPQFRKKSSELGS